MSIRAWLLTLALLALCAPLRAPARRAGGSFAELLTNADQLIAKVRAVATPRAPITADQAVTAARFWAPGRSPFASYGTLAAF